jgi:hypothetical protein
MTEVAKWTLGSNFIHLHKYNKEDKLINNKNIHENPMIAYDWRQPDNWKFKLMNHSLYTQPPK